MTERLLSPPGYVVVCVALVALTVLTVGVSFAPLHGPWHIVVGLAIAAVKASLVVLFFMHAIKSDKVTWAVIAFSAFWLGILLVLTYTDYFSRGFVPLMPGH
jgi:cytochrome c oxidase subunit 4